MLRAYNPMKEGGVVVEEVSLAGGSFMTEGSMVTKVVLQLCSSTTLFIYK
jgi:hypothetical protein